MKQNFHLGLRAKSFALSVLQQAGAGVPVHTGNEEEKGLIPLPCGICLIACFHEAGEDYLVVLLALF